MLNILDEYILDEANYDVIPSNTILYRARIIHLQERKPDWGLKVTDNGELVGFDEAGSREAPLGMSSEGRNNISGVSYLYLSNNAETACAEVKPVITQLVSVAEFLVKEPINIVNFTDNSMLHHVVKEKDLDLGMLFGRIMERYFLPVTEPSQYKATQIITDHIRKTGVDGVSYKSFYNEKGINYTIFNSDRKRLEFLGSRMVSLQNETRIFWDFNNKKTIEAQTMGLNKYDQKIADAMIETIRKELENQTNNS